MARYACQGESEPLMRLERPSTASSQTTAHIINACFNEVLSNKQLDSKDISNLAVSKRENIESESDYQEFYVDKLTKIADESKKRLDELSKLERHIMQAKAKALAEDEKNLSILVGSCPSYKSIGLPQGPSQFRNYVDEELLSQHSLLVPSKSLGPVRSVQPPISKKTISISSIPPLKFAKPWQDSLTAGERHIEKHGMSELHRRTVFLKNPKFSVEANSTSSFGPVKKRKKNSGKKTSSVPTSSFLIQPAEVLFSVYHPGETLKAVVELRNISGVSRQIRLVPIKSDYFTVSLGSFPTEDGLIAPGMECSFTITFRPDSLASYRDQMQFNVSNGECLLVPLIGKRPAPKLSLPGVLECGGYLVGETKLWTLQCCNLGGEGNFRLMKDEGVEEEESSTKKSDSIEVGPFSVSPRDFYLPAEKGCIDLTVKFTPPDVGHFVENLYMACDNGEVLSYTLSGTAEKLCIGCTQIRPSSTEEKYSFSDEIKANLSEDASLTSIHDFKTIERSEVIETPSIELDTVNPHDSSFKTVIIQNFSNVNIPFCWRYYQPITQSFNFTQKEEGVNPEPCSNTPCLSEHSPFFISPGYGTLPARQAVTFVIRFTPIKPGHFTDMGYLTLTRRVKDQAMDCNTEGVKWTRLPDSKVSICCLQLQGYCEPFRIEIDPAAIIIPGEIPIASKVRKTFKILNHSISANVCYKWKSCHQNITVEPESGRIGSGDSCNCEIVVEGLKEGPFSSTLLCNLENWHDPFPLHVSGRIDGPVVTLDRGFLNFGLILFGRSSCLTFCITNQSSCFVDFGFRQVVQERDSSFMDHPCLSFSPAEGCLPPHGSSSVEVQCQPQCSGRLRSIMQLLVNGRPHKCVSVESEVQRPALCIDSCQVAMEGVYVGIPCSHTVVLKNCSLLPAHFTWSSQVIGEDARHCRVDIKATTGLVGPREELGIPVDIVWTEEGNHRSIVLRCDVLDMKIPLFISFSADVKGLSVEYRLLPTGNADDHQENPLSIDDDGMGILELGQNNELGRPISARLKILNTSAIPTTIDLAVTNFPPSPNVHKPPQQGKPSNVIVKAGSITVEQETSKYIASLLSTDKGACFVVEPSQASLPAFDSITVTITAYSNLWGEYADHLICSVEGLEETDIAMRIGFVGCPVEFQPTATFGRTLARFGTHLIGASAKRRKIKMRNSGPVELRIDWKVLDLVANDSKMINLITVFGTPFPKIQNNLTETNPVQTTSAIVSVKDNSDNLESGSERDEQGVHLGEDVCTEVSAMEEESYEKKIQVFIELHEGKETTSSPFSIHPKQVVIPAHGHAAVEVAFIPTSAALTSLGEEPCAYALGYISIDGQETPHVVRKTCYDVEPLRIDFMAGIEHPKLVLDYDEDNALHFSCPASLLLHNDMQIVPEAYQEHSFTLVNPTTSIQHFDFYTSSSHFFISDVQATSYLQGSPALKDGMIAVRPHGRIGFSIKFCFVPNDVAMEAAVLTERNTYECCFEGKLQIKFSLGFTQEFSFTAAVSLPMLMLSTEICEMGVVHLGKSASSSFSLTNKSFSKAVWTTKISEELANAVSVSPQSGLLMPHLHEGQISTQTIQLIFAPKLETTYDGSLTLKEVLTNQTFTVRVTGRGSPDEQHF